MTGLADGIWVTPVATKPGCHLTGTHDGFTGRAQLAKGFGVLFSLLMTK